MRADGSAIDEAMVYAVPKEIDGGGKHDGLPETFTDEKGGWTLALRDPARWWLAASAEGFAPVFLDGAELAATGDVGLTLLEGPEVRIRVRDAEGKRPAGRIQAFVRPLAAVTQHRPGPTGAAHFDLCVEIEADGEGRVRLPGFVPFGVTLAEYFEPQCETEVTEVREPVEVVELRTQPNCHLLLRAVDASTGEPPRPWHSTPAVFAVDEPTGRRFPLRLGPAARVVGPADYTTWRTWGRLPPGRYTIGLEVLGWRPWTRTGVEVPHWGAEVPLTAALERDPASASLRLRTPGVVAPYGLWGCIKEHSEGPEGWRFTGGHAPVGEEYAVEGLRAEAYDLLVYAATAWGAPVRVGYAAGLVAASVLPAPPSAGSGGAARRDFAPGTGGHPPPGARLLTVGPGVRVSLARTLPPDTHLRRLRVLAPDGVALPLVELEPGRFTLYERGEIPPRTARLGPYPFPSVRLEVETWDGETLAFDVSDP